MTWKLSGAATSEGHSRCFEERSDASLLFLYFGAFHAIQRSYAQFIKILHFHFKSDVMKLYDGIAELISKALRQHYRVSRAPQRVFISYVKIELKEMSTQVHGKPNAHLIAASLYVRGGNICHVGSNLPKVQHNSLWQKTLMPRN